MDDFLNIILKILKKLKIKPIIYGSFGVSNYLGEFKIFADLDLLIDDDFIHNKWGELKELFELNNFKLIDEKEHEFMLENKKVGFASKNILMRDKIINNFSDLIKYKDKESLTLKPEDFLKAYEFSIKDGYRIEKRNKKDADIISKLKIYINNYNLKI